MSNGHLKVVKQNGFFSLIQLGDDYENFKVSWAGPGPRLPPGPWFDPIYCFGSEDGRILITDSKSAILDRKAAKSSEAISCVAFFDHWCAASTREDVTTFSLSKMDASTNACVPFGAHSVVATPTGFFAAPMGRTGIMILKAGSQVGDDVGTLTPDSERAYFHSVIALPSTDETTVLVCAAGWAGIGIIELNWIQDSSYNMRIANTEGIEVVDVCRLDSNVQSSAVAGVSRDGTLIFVRDAFRDKQIQSIKFQNIKGVVYRVLSVGEDILVLTSRAIYVVKQLGAKVRKGDSLEKSTAYIMVIPIEAVDANTVSGQLLIVTADKLLIDNTKAIQRAKPDDFQYEESPEPILSNPPWHEHESTLQPALNV